MAVASNFPPVGRNKNGTFVRGHATPWGGRKPGSRGKLSEAFLADLHAEWKRSGKAVLEKVAKSEPAVFLKVCAGVLPRLIDIDAAINVHSELAIEVRDFAEAYERWGKVVGASPPLIEATIKDDVVEEEVVQGDD
jgi:hypothetical protein